jgi:hypothetical protein
LDITDTSGRILLAWKDVKRITVYVSQYSELSSILVVPASHHRLVVRGITNMNDICKEFATTASAWTSVRLVVLPAFVGTSVLFLSLSVGIAAVLGILISLQYC